MRDRPVPHRQPDRSAGIAWATARNAGREPARERHGTAARWENSSSRWAAPGHPPGRIGNWPHRPENDRQPASFLQLRLRDFSMALRESKTGSGTEHPLRGASPLFKVAGLCVARVPAVPFRGAARHRTGNRWRDPRALRRGLRRHRRNGAGRRRAGQTA